MRPDQAQSREFNGDSSQNLQYRCGPFLLDATRRVLLREGERIPLSAKSHDTLLSLVMRRGETVTKDELLSAIWGDAVVEENSLNKCISEIRKALGERRGQHEYIVTMTGVGYRFVAPVTQETVPEKNGTADAPKGPGATPWWIAVATAALFALTAGMYFFARGAPSQRRVAVILPVKVLSNTTDTDWLSTAVGEMLYHELAGRPPASVGGLWLIPPEDAAGMQRDLPPRRTPAETLGDIRKYSGAQIALAGTVTVLPGGGASPPLRIDLSVKDLLTGDVLASKSADGPEMQMFTLVRGLADEVREALAVGGPMAKAASSRPPFPASSMKPYAEGLRALRASDPATARDRLLDAVAADPSNALSYLAISVAWSELGYQRNAEDAARRAFELSASLDDLDRLAVEGRYRLATRDWKRAGEIYEAIWKLVPDNIEYPTALIEVYGNSGKIDRARNVIAKLRASMGDDPRVDLLEAKLAAFTWADHRRIAVLAKHAAETARQRGMRDLHARALLWQARAMFSAGEAGSAPLRAEARRICEELRDSGCVAWSLRSDGNQYLVEGRTAEARDSYTRALAAARQNGNVDEQINELNGLGLLYFNLGDVAASDGCYREAVPLTAQVPNAAAMIHNNYAGMLAAVGRLPEARQYAESGLAQARANHEVESEADALAVLAVLDRLGGNPRRAVALDREALAVAKRSEKKMAEVEIEFDLAMSLAAAGDTAAAAQAIRSAKSAGAEDGDLNSTFIEAAVALAESRDADAGELAAAMGERARKLEAPLYEALAEALRARALLAQGRLADARIAAARAVSIRQAPDHSLTRFEAQFAEATTAADASGKLAALAREAEDVGYLALAQEMRLAAGHRAPWPAR